MKTMQPSKKQQIHTLLKGIETGDPDSVIVVNEAKYIQHNPHTHEGSVGLADLFKKLSKTNPKVDMIRGFEDGDYVFAHMRYDFSSVKSAFEVFRFEDGYAVEHWDNIQTETGPNASGHTMLDGQTELQDTDKTESNRELVRQFVEEVLIGKKHEKLPLYISTKNFIQHAPTLKDGIEAFKTELKEKTETGTKVVYHKHHKILAEGNFVLAQCEGELNAVHTSFYHLYRLNADKIVEQWQTTETIPPETEWKNTNGKF